MAGKLMKEIEAVEEKIKYVEIKYDRLLLFFFSLVVLYILIEPEYSIKIESFIRSLAGYGYIGIFIAGSMYTTYATSPVAAYILFIFGEFYNPLLIAALGAAGACAIDFIIYTISKKYSILDSRGGRSFLVKKIQPGHILYKFAPLIALFIIGSPLPDELADIFMGQIRYDKKKFLIISYLGNFLGILIISLFGASFG